MISCVNPSYTSANHTLYTLRYSDRLKEKTKQHSGGNYNNINAGDRGINSNNNNTNISPSPKNKNDTKITYNKNVVIPKILFLMIKKLTLKDYKVKKKKTPNK